MLSYVHWQGTCRKPPIGIKYTTGEIDRAARARHIGDVLRNNVALYRKGAGLTQTALADAIGTTRSMLVKLERGERDLTSDWLEKIARAVGAAPYLLIAPADILPSEGELTRMLADAQSTLPAGLPYSEWPRAVAAGLHTRLLTLAGDRASDDS